MFCSFVCFSECLDFDQGFGRGKVRGVGGGGQWGMKPTGIQLHGVLIESAGGTSVAGFQMPFSHYIRAYQSQV